MTIVSPSASTPSDQRSCDNHKSLGVAGGGSGMRAWNPVRFLPKVTTASLGFMAAVGAGAGLLIRDAVGSGEWLAAIKDGFAYAIQRIDVLFTETVPALSSTAAIASYIGVGAFLASVVNLVTFARGITAPNQAVIDQLQRGAKTVITGAASGAAWGAMAGTLGAGAGAAPGAVLGGAIGAAVGLVQAVLLLMNTTPVAALR